jgi:hypothetical protein
LAPLGALAPSTNRMATVVGSEVRLHVAQREQLRVVVPATIIAQPESSVFLPIRVQPVAEIPGRSFVRVRGLPATAALTEGHSIAPGVWAVPLHALTELKVNLPTGVSGQSELVITLVNVDGTILAEASCALLVGVIAQTITPGLGEQSKGAQDPEKPRDEMSAQERQRAIGYLKKGDEQLATGNFGTARLFYERAATAGLAQAALALARTYDPNELKRLNERGVQPDSELARRWYERARQLGASDIDEHLRRLGEH